MSHLFDFLLRGARKAGFAEGLQTGHQEVERELAELRGHVKQLEDELHKGATGMLPRLHRQLREGRTTTFTNRELM